MPSIRVIVKIPLNTNVPRDVIENVFYFTGSDTPITQAATAATRLLQFYNGVNSPGATTLGSKYAGNVNRSACTFTSYNMADPTPRPPIAITPWTMAAAAGSPLNFPSEVSLCMSYAAPVIAGQPAARSRGRIFLGPFASSVSTSLATVEAVPTAAFLDVALGAGKQLALSNAAGCSWAMYSRADDLIKVITRGWVDNAFDTQRRRGVATTARVVWP